ncbi:MAG: hypothetical protein P8L85_21805 [Rubripirellula sp.]|nr:hypothetical protein [Rubripirellula sp.]
MNISEHEIVIVLGWQTGHDLWHWHQAESPPIPNDTRKQMEGQAIHINRYYACRRKRQSIAIKNDGRKTEEANNPYPS